MLKDIKAIGEGIRRMSSATEQSSENILIFTLPDIGEGVAEGEILAWLAEEGQFIEEDQALLEVMTDKVTVEIPSPRSGILVKKYAQVGDVVPVGNPLVDLHFGEGSLVLSSASATVSKAIPAPAVVSPVVQGVGEEKSPTSPLESLSVLKEPSSSTVVLAAPATRQLAKRLGVALEELTGSGPQGRITPQDVESAVSPSPQASFFTRGGATTFPVQDLPYSGIRKKIGQRLLASTQEIPSFAYVDEIRMDKVEALRRDLKSTAAEAGVKLTPLTFVLKAIALTLPQFPQLNSRLNETQTLIHQFPTVNLGLAVDTPTGLVVPVIPNAQTLHLFELAKVVQDLGQWARQGQLKASHMQGGTFTVSSIGSIGGVFGIPIINAPEVAILGVNQLRKVPVVNESDAIVVGQVMNLSLSADHRVVDGADAARFINQVKAVLESPAQLLL